jgi:hypothetical protein
LVQKNTIHSKETFLTYWNKHYPETPPINYFFKHRLQERWLRIHSLPYAKRYADTDEEWDILLHRQNTVLTDLIEDGAVIKIVVNFTEITNPLFNEFNFINIGVFVDREAETVFQSFLFETEWQINTLNLMLKMIAQDEMRAYIIAKDCLIAPYDGGMDLIFKDAHTRDLYKKQYQPWLSAREDGL